MILEEINGAVVATIIRESGQMVELAVGDYFSDHESSTIAVTGNGKIVIRVDPNCTFEVRGVELATQEPVAQEIALEDTIAAVEKPPVIVKPATKVGSKSAPKAE